MTYSNDVGPDSSVGVATRYGLDSQRIEPWLILVVARFLGLRVRIPPGTWMFLLCVVSKDERQNVDNEETETSTNEVQSTRE